MYEFKKYLKELNNVKRNLTKFYYYGASEILKPHILDCITSVNIEISRVTKRIREQEEYFQRNQVTIYDLIERSF